MLNRFKIYLLTLLIPLLTTQKVIAISEFSTTYNVDYQVTQNGITHTTFNIDLKNNLSNIYASEFSLSIGSTKLENINAYNQDGSLEVKVITGDKTTNVTIPFSKNVLGKDKSQVFSLEFDSLDFANQLGSVWEISIPKLQNSESLTSYRLTLSVPKSIGNPSTISPKPISITPSGVNNIYRFTQKDLLSSGVSAIFGQNQNYDFDLRYHLENPNVHKIKTEIALPPDTAYQRVYYQTLSPKPNDIYLDKDGNWLASYFLSGNEVLEITATGSASISLYPIKDHQTIAISDQANYLSSQQYWEADNPRIKELAKDLKTSQNIYQYVVDNLIYDYGRLTGTTTRFGAANTLDNTNSAVCMEFTDLFIAIARSAGIPARAVNGYAYTTNSALRPLSLKRDILHAWPEYYDQETKLWIPIDPTWGNTTGGVDFFNQTDLNHFTFAILGEDSTYPIPVGAYKLESNLESKDVNISFGSSTKPEYSTQLKIHLPQTALAGVDLKGELIITNTGTTALYNQEISLLTQNLKANKDTWIIPVLPPFGAQILPITLKATNWNDNFTETVKAISDLSQTNDQIIISPAYSYLTTSPNFKYALGSIALIACIIILKLIKKKI